MWGGNIIQTSEGLYFIDWETAMLAPPEREMICFVTQRPADFIDAYSQELGRKFTPNVDLLRFYCFQSQLRNLTNWMMNILYRYTDETQIKNDLEMINFHCLNRWECLEKELSKLEDFYDLG